MPRARIKKEYTHLEMEAALCVWEWINDVTLDDTPQNLPEWVEFRGGVGSVELRHQSIVLGKWCLKIYDLLTASNPDFFEALAYDWEVIPMMMKHANTPSGEPAIYKESLPDPRAIAQLVARQVLFQRFVWDCEREAENQWKYRDLVSDHDGEVEAAFENGDEPATFIRELGDELELHKF